MGLTMSVGGWTTSSSAFGSNQLTFARNAAAREQRNVAGYEVTLCDDCFAAAGDPLRS
jgi:hypothetical protein